MITPTRRAEGLLLFGNEATPYQIAEEISGFEARLYKLNPVDP